MNAYVYSAYTQYPGWQSALIECRQFPLAARSVPSTVPARRGETERTTRSDYMMRPATRPGAAQLQSLVDPTGGDALGIGVHLLMFLAIGRPDAARIGGERARERDTHYYKN